MTSAFKAPATKPAILWISHYFPTPADSSRGTWALETLLALQDLDWRPVVAVPVPWIPRWAGLSDQFKQFATLPRETVLEGIRVHYLRCPFYPQRLVRHYLSYTFPSLESDLPWMWLKKPLHALIARHAPVLVHANFAYPAGALARRIKADMQVPYVFQERSLQAPLLATRRRAYGHRYRKIVRNADAVVYNNQRSGSLLREWLPAGTLLSRVTSGYNEGRIASRRHIEDCVTNESPTILCVGSFSKRRKGQHILLEALAAIRSEFPDVQADFIGSGHFQHACQHQAQALGLGRQVRFLGQRPHEEVLKAMSRCTLFVLPSRDEAFGSVYCEAMALGRPVIACDDSGLAEVVHTGKHALLIPPGDAAALCKAMERLLRDPQERRRIGAAAQELAIRSFSYEHIAREIGALYNRILGESESPR